MSVALEDVACIYFVLDVVEAGVVAVGDDGHALTLELGEVVDDFAAEECAAVLECRLIDNHLGSLGLDALHDALDGTLAEVVGVGLHGEAEDADGDLVLGAGIPLAVGTVVACLAQHLVGDVVLAGAVALDDGAYHVLGNVLKVGQKLLGVLRQAVAAVAEAGVVVVLADARVEADAVDDGLGVEALDFGVCVEFVEVADAQGKVGVGEELDGFGLLHAHEEGVDVLLDGTLLEQVGEDGGLAGGIGTADGLDGGVLFGETGSVGIYDGGIAHDDAAGIEVVVEGLALAKELGREEQVELVVLKFGLVEELQRILDEEAAGVAYGYGALDDHDGVGVDAEDQVDDLLDVTGVEEVLLGIVVGGGCDDDEVGVAVGGGSVEGRLQVEPDRIAGSVLACEVFLDVIVLYR